MPTIAEVIKECHIVDEQKSLMLQQLQLAAFPSTAEVDEAFLALTEGLLTALGFTPRQCSALLGRLAAMRGDAASAALDRHTEALKAHTAVLERHIKVLELNGLATE